MGDFEYYSELVVFLESALGREFVRRLIKKQEVHTYKKQSLARKCSDSTTYDAMKDDFLKQGVYVNTYDEILADMADLGAIKDLVKRLKEKAIRG